MNEIEEFLEAFEKVVMYFNILDDEKTIEKMTPEEYEQLRQLVIAYDKCVWGDVL